MQIRSVVTVAQASYEYPHLRLLQPWMNPRLKETFPFGKNGRIFGLNFRHVRVKLKPNPIIPLARQGSSIACIFRFFVLPIGIFVLE
jgi:hypothetical protein